MATLFRDPIILVEFFSALLTFYYVLRVTMLTNRGSSMVIGQNRDLETPVTVRQIFNVGALLPIRKRSLRGQKFHAMLTRVFIA